MIVLNPSRWRNRIRMSIVILVPVLAAVIYFNYFRGTQPGPEQVAADNPFPLTPIASSLYSNTGPDARYVGSARCRDCHEDRHESFRHTGMGRSMAPVDLAREPVDASFEHPPSRRIYEVLRRDGQFWHRESLVSNGREKLVLAELPMSYVVGSGRHSLTYVGEAEGFLVESPLTWYSRSNKWGMSPGYDDPKQPGFQRAVGGECLFCHAGRIEVADGSYNRVRIIEAAIACERCHGPGSIHIARHMDRPNAPREAGHTADATIVNPARLTLELREAVCQQCHLRPTSIVVARGRSLSDFRPGLPLQDFLQAYVLESPDAAMTVVSHVEQMHESKCHKASGQLTCLTCHSPHSEPPPARAVAHYTAACLTCHHIEQCKVEELRRKQESPENDCVQCHMPRAPTEIPHLAFTHHRIGRHTKPAAVLPIGDTVSLRPFLNELRMSPIDQRRSLGLGYVEAAERETSPARSNTYRERAFGLLSGVWDEGLRDPLVSVSLARLQAAAGRDVTVFAEEALTHQELTGQERCNALYLSAEKGIKDGRYEEALPLARELTRLRRHAMDWLLLSECLGRQGDDRAAISAMETATRINPRLWAVHKHLANYYRQHNDPAKAIWHEQRAIP